MIKLYKISSIENKSVFTDNSKQYEISDDVSENHIEIIENAYKKAEPVGLSIDNDKITKVAPSFKDKVSEIIPCRDGYRISFDLGSGIYRIANDMRDVLEIFSASLQNEVDIWFATSPYGDIYDAVAIG